MSRSNLRATTLLTAGSVAGTVDIVRDTHLAIALCRDVKASVVPKEDWRVAELLRDNRQEIPFLQGATHYYIGATLTRDVNHPAGRLIGDLLVRMPRAVGRGSRGRRLPFKLEPGRERGGLAHFDLLNHPDVATQLIKWLR